MKESREIHSEQMDVGQENSNGIDVQANRQHQEMCTHHRKKLKVETTVDEREYFEFLTTAGASCEWKLALCHVPADLPFTQVEQFFRPIIVKKLDRGAKYDGRQVMEVSFWTEADIQRVVQEHQNKYLMGHRVTLMLPGEAEQELVRTRVGWRSLPQVLVKEILHFLTPFRLGKLLKRVCHTWKNCIKQAEKTVPNLLVVPFGDLSLNPKSVRDQYPSNVTHVIVDAAPRLENLETMLRLNEQLKQLTLWRCENLDTHDISRTGMVSNVAPVVLVCADSFLRFSFRCDGNIWSMAMYFPYLKMQIPYKFRSTPWEAYSLFVRQLMVRLDSLSMWWPYPEEQTEWLRESLAKLDGEPRRNVTSYSTRDRIKGL